MIKATVGEQKTHEVVPFPKLMWNGGKEIVLALIEEGGGYSTVFKISGFGKENGSIVKGFRIEERLNWFSDYNEPITLQNILP